MEVFKYYVLRERKMANINNQVKKISSELLKTCVNSSDYYKFGAEYFGPFLYGFTHWLYSSVNQKKYSKIFFLSRDGYIMKQAFDIFNTNHIECEYVYFSRKRLRQALLNKCSDYKDSLRYLSKEHYISFGKILEYYGIPAQSHKDISSKYAIELETDFLFSALENNKDIEQVYNDLKVYIDQYSLVQESLLEKYINQIGMVGNCAIVDIGWYGSMQFYLEQFIKLKEIKATISGYYIGIDPNRTITGEAYGYLFDRTRLKLKKQVLCFFGGYEKLFQSLEGSTNGYINSNEKIDIDLAAYEYENDPKSMNHIRDWQAGALGFVKCSLKNQLSITDDRLLALPLIRVGKNPTNKQLALFKFLYNMDGTKVYYLCQKPIYQYNLTEFIHAFRNSVWKTGFMKSAFKFPFPYYFIYELIKK